MTQELFLKWLKRFAEYVKKDRSERVAQLRLGRQTRTLVTRAVSKAQNQRHLLILDYHSSHASLEIFRVAVGAGIDILFLPAHMSQMQQPLDVGVFKAYKQAITSHTDILQFYNGEIRKEQIVTIISKTCKDAFTVLIHNIRTRFKMTGIYPYSLSSHFFSSTRGKLIRKWKL